MKSIDLDGAQFRYDEIGEDRDGTIIVLYGGRGIGDHRGEFVAYRPLSDRYRVIAYDQRGCGASSLTPHVCPPDGRRRCDPAASRRQADHPYWRLVRRHDRAQLRGQLSRRPNSSGAAGNPRPVGIVMSSKEVSLYGLARVRD